MCYCLSCVLLVLVLCVTSEMLIQQTSFSINRSQCFQTNLLELKLWTFFDSFLISMWRQTNKERRDQHCLADYFWNHKKQSNNFDKKNRNFSKTKQRNTNRQYKYKLIILMAKLLPVLKVNLKNDEVLVREYSRLTKPVTSVFTSLYGKGFKSTWQNKVIFTIIILSLF